MLLEDYCCDRGKVIVFYNPFVELINKLLRRMKKLGSPLYWIWITVAAIPGLMAVSQMKQGASFSDTASLWILVGILYLAPLPLIIWHEAKRKKNEIKNND